MQWKKSLSALRLALAISAVLMAGAGHAQNYPSRPITFVYGYPAGSSTDSAWRSVALEASKRLGQPIVYENRPGANGRLGLDSVMRAKPDGYTIGVFNNSLLVVQPLMDPKLAIEPGKNYTPVMIGLETYLLMVARPNAPFKDVKGLIAYAKANPGKLNVGSPGSGTGSHLGIAMVGAQAGIEYTHIPYKGAAPALHAMLAGEIDVMFTDLLAKPYIDSGKMLGLGVGGAKRWSLLPKLPTIQEAGLSGFVNSAWSGVVAPAGVPDGVVATLSQAFTEALGVPELRAKLESAGWIVRPGTAQEATALIRADTELYRPVVKAANIKID